MTISTPGADDVFVPAPEEFSYEDTPSQQNQVYNLNGGGRRLQFLSPIPYPSKPWGSVFFYMDGRIRENLANGTNIWNDQFYDSSANPNTTSNSSYNSTAHLKIRVFMNGSFILNWANGDVEDNMWDDTWAKFYF